ncbi:MAG: DNA repair protein RadA [Synergistetes bacterium]|nr:DNA repair protein RadA [Synergistota bacterium]
MSKRKKTFVCKVCGYKSATWLGSCPNCGSWDSFVEVVEGDEKYHEEKTPVVTHFEDVPVDSSEAVSTGIREVDKVLGGGIVPASVVLLGGEPGIGKSTLALQIAGNMSRTYKVLYVSAEETPAQIKKRGQRIGMSSTELYLMCDGDLDRIVSGVETLSPGFLIIDSIQMITSSNYSSMAGSIFQVREIASRITNVSKAKGIASIIIGHITKEGNIAGPKTLEHVVDVVTTLEGDRRGIYRMFRSSKNRYGTANEIGILEMTSKGLVSVENPYQVFLSCDRPSGATVGVAAEGLRPMVVETQSLVTRSYLTFPRRVATAFDINRLYLITAVLEKRAKIYLGKHDIYANIVGGIKFVDTALDLPMAMAMLSSLKDVKLPVDVAFIGELGLGGELRPVPYIMQRVSEAVRLGFNKIFCPYGSRINEKQKDKVILVKNMKDVISTMV